MLQAVRRLRLRTKLLLLTALCGPAALAVFAGVVVREFSANQDAQEQAVAAALQDAATDNLRAVQQTLATAIATQADHVSRVLLDCASGIGTRQAARDFRDAVTAYSGQVGLDAAVVADRRRQLAEYYHGPFAARYRQDSGGADPGVATVLAALDDVTVALQHAYIQTNPHPLGSKDQMAEPVGEHGDHGRLHRRFHPYFCNLLQRHGLYDIFVIDPRDGRVVYTVFKELDFATSLATGPWAKTGLADTYRRALAAPVGKVVVSDFAAYRPSYGAPAAFAGTRIEQDGDTIGVLVFQLPLDGITKALAQRAGLRQTGEAYLVGADRLMRSDSFRDAEHRSVLASWRDPQQGRVATEGVLAALAGRPFAGLQRNYADKPVLAVCGPVSYGGNAWAMAVEIEAEEALAAVDSLRDEANARQSAFLWLAFGWVVGMGAFACWIGYAMSQTITGPIGSVIAVARRLADGDLTARVPCGANDEIGAMGQALNQALQALEATLRESRQGAGSMAEASGQVEQASAHLANAASGQAASLQEIRSSMSEVTALSQGTARSAREARDLASSAEKVVSEGQATTTRMTTAMQEIREASDAVARILKTIDDIAFQTNLLALNAAVEAARAGESGKGFAVVAEEVRNLAQRCAAAAREVGTLVQQSSQRTATGVGLAEDVMRLFDQIQQSTQQVAGLLGKVDTATANESESLGVVARAVENLDQVTQTNASSSEELAAAASDCRRNLQALRQSIERFQVGQASPGQVSEGNG
ncbi:MAG: methyl-accepting chemotaxis protein [Planctomycetes bacterium]|nr:methyl-accepting chemotaxis protein [Planctomycetota bacterium]